jgi:uncharacterized repeat protein (TIGR03803 family)
MRSTITSYPPVNNNNSTPEQERRVSSDRIRNHHSAGFGAASPCDEGCGRRQGGDLRILSLISRDGTKTVLYAFQGGKDGLDPRSDVIMDKAGNLYGTTTGGGGVGCKKFDGCGTAFKVTPAGKEKVLYAFGGKSGSMPEAGLLFGKKGALYGTTSGGGKPKDGVVFSLTTK